MEPQLVVFISEKLQDLFPELSSSLDTHMRSKTTGNNPVGLCSKDTVVRDQLRTYYECYRDRGLLFLQSVYEDGVGRRRRRVHLLLFRQPDEVLDVFCGHYDKVDKIVVFVVKEREVSRREMKSFECLWLEAQVNSRLDIHVVSSHASTSSSTSSSKWQEDAMGWIRCHFNALMKTSIVMSEEQTSSSMAFSKSFKSVKIDAESLMGLRRLWQLQQQFLHSSIAQCRSRQCGMSDLASLANLAENNFDDVGCSRLRQILKQMYNAENGDVVPHGGKSASQ